MQGEVVWHDLGTQQCACFGRAMYGRKLSHILLLLLLLLLLASLPLFFLLVIFFSAFSPHQRQAHT